MIGDAKAGCHYGEELRESDEQRAERSLGQMLRRRKWGEEELRRRLKGDKIKVTMAKQLRKETTMTWEWIANRLSMGNWRAAANAVRATSKT